MTTPLPWTGKLRTPEEIAEHAPMMDAWFEARKKESLQRRESQTNGRSLKKSSRDRIEKILDGRFYKLEQKPKKAASYVKTHNPLNDYLFVVIS